MFCTVTDARRACTAIVNASKGAGIEGAVVAFVEDGKEEEVDPRVLWPPDFVGTFTVL